MISRLEIYGVVLAIVLAIGGGVVWTYNRAIAKAERLEAQNAELMQANKDQATENAGLRVRQAQLDAAMAKREGARQAAADVERKVSDAIGKAVASDASARDWWNVSVPNGVRLAGSDDASKDGKGAAAGGAAPARAGP